MRRCGRSEELREALAAEEPMGQSLAAHVAACAECVQIRGAARRFESGLDTAMAELVTDALPPSTVIVARTAPRSALRRPSPGIVVSAVATAGLVAFAVVGVVATGASISEAVRGDSAAGSDASDEYLDRVDCYLGESTVDVTVERVGDAAPRAVVAYCMGVEGMEVDRRAAVTCVRSQSRDAAARMQRRAGEAGEAFEVDADRAYLGACTRVEDGDAADHAPEAGTILAVPAAPFGSWDEAAAGVAWPVLRPGWLPDGYQLAALQGFAAPSEPEAIDSVVATYLRNGSPLSIDQFVVVDPDAFRIQLTIPGDELGKVSTGRTTVGEHPAFWASGVVVPTVGGPGSDVDALVLTWRDDGVGYRITAQSDDLDALRRLAESLTEE